MAWTQSDIDALKKAIATGAQEVEYADGRRVRFRSLAHMRETLALMEEGVSGTQQPRVSYVKFNRGLS